jgi:hypothetical protein
MGVLVVVVGVVVVTAGILLCVFESGYRAALDTKTRTIELLTEQIRMAKEHEEACKVAAMVRRDASDLELNAVALLAGPPMLLETFVHLTHRVSIGFPWDPLKRPIQWKAPGRQTHEEVRRNAALLVLWDREYIGGVLPAGYGDYTAVASNGAMAVKAVLDRLPQSIKAQVHGEQQLSLALPPTPLNSQLSTLS